MESVNVLIVDLNNFARYPTIAVGYLTAILRQNGARVTVFSPLAFGVLGVPRETPETRLRNLAQRFNYLMASTGNPFASSVKSFVRNERHRWSSRKNVQIIDAFDQLQFAEFDVVLISTYLMYYDVCVEIGKRCQKASVPLLIGGPYFANRQVASAWLKMPGLTALVAGEVETDLAEIVRGIAGAKDVSTFSGVLLPDGRGAARAPLTDLNNVPFPDYQDFPWSAYPNKIIPMITGRGCGWGVCAFCSDVTSTAGRTFRTRSPSNVLAEIEHQSKKYEASLFVFTDLKLNSNLEMWSTLIDYFSGAARDKSWICAVHVGSAQPNGLDRASLFRAKRAGLARMTTGLELAVSGCLI